jgi:hypothetical protein
MVHGLTIVGEKILFEKIVFKSPCAFMSPPGGSGMMVDTDPVQGIRIFTAAVVGTTPMTGHKGPKGLSTLGVASAIEHPWKKNKRERYFDLFAAPKAEAKAKRNAMRDLSPKDRHDRFMREVLDAKHGVGRVATLKQEKKVGERKATDAWVAANQALHGQIKRLGFEDQTKSVHIVMCRDDSKALGRKLESINQISAEQLWRWVKIFKAWKPGDDGCEKLTHRIRRLRTVKS